VSKEKLEEEERGREQRSGMKKIKKGRDALGNDALSFLLSLSLSLSLSFSSSSPRRSKEAKRSHTHTHGKVKKRERRE
jgi:hypothetical protein